MVEAGNLFLKKMKLQRIITKLEKYCGYQSEMKIFG